MFLTPATERKRDRSRSRGRRSRDETQRPSVTKLADVREPSYVHPEHDLTDYQRVVAHGGGGWPYPYAGGMGGMLPGGQPLYSYGSSGLVYQSGSPSLDASFQGRLPGAFPQEQPRRGDGLGQQTTRPWEDPSAQNYRRPYVTDDPQDRRGNTSYNYDHGARGDGNGDTRSKRERNEDDLAYGKLPGPSRSRRPESLLAHGTNSSMYMSGSRMTVEPGRGDRDRSRDGRRDKSPGPSTLAPESGHERRDRSRSRDGRGAARDKSPQPPTARMSNLTVGSNSLPYSTHLSAAPPSPLLESYRGTYQDCSPMPSPLLFASRNPGSDLRALEALALNGSDFEGDGKKHSRRARFNDAEDIASQLAKALRGNRAPDTQPLIEILPSLSHEQVMELRTQYKRIVKTGSDRKGVNIAKHIRVRLKDEDPNLMKACYTVALGKWESEAYWANFWYQGNKTRRELLIESLMGRTNEEIRQIKRAFTDKKYDKSLTRCMKTELKEDKFKKAVLMVLDENRMDDFDPHGRMIPLDGRLVDEDVSDLHQAIKAEKGGESAMIGIVVNRGDTHLWAVLQEYERRYRENFARQALKKSSNLVGELLAHILNGVINRPVRDALLLHHALTASRKDNLRRELLISRLVRFHWNPLHMQAIKKAYRERYGEDLSDAVKGATKGQWGRFCRELCIARMPERVEIIR